MTTFPDSLYLQTHELCKRGDEFAERRNFVEARKSYREALALFPEDHLQMEGVAWIYASTGEAELALGERDAALECFSRAAQCPGGWGHPYVHLRLGQLRLDQGDEENAALELSRAYRTGGIAVFMDGDPKYLNFLRDRSLI